MFKTISKFAIAAAAVVALPGMAEAGTVTASGTAAMSVASQCSVTGATVNLGSFTTNDTWGTVLGQNGGWTALGVYTAGSRGFEYANFGSVTCDNGMPYSLAIWGTSASIKAIRITVAGKTAYLAPFIKKVGATTAANTGPATGAGAAVYSGSSLAATGTGAAQILLGSAQLDLSPSLGLLASDRLATPGTYTDTLTYTLNF